MTGTVAAGAKLTTHWKQWTHRPATFMVYMAKCPGSCNSWDGSGKVWCKNEHPFYQTAHITNLNPSQDLRARSHIRDRKRRYLGRRRHLRNPQRNHHRPQWASRRVHVQTRTHCPAPGKQSPMYFPPHHSYTPTLFSSTNAPTQSIQNAPNSPLRAPAPHRLLPPT